MSYWSTAAGLLLLGLLHGCTTPAAEDALYRALGARDGIEALVDEFLVSLSANEAVLPLFLNTDIMRFRQQLALQLCEISGGPCRYGGDSMRDTHRGMQISRAQFNSVVEDLIAAMERRSLPTGTQNALLARLAPLYSDISNQ